MNITAPALAESKHLFAQMKHKCAPVSLTVEAMPLRGSVPHTVFGTALNTYRSPCVNAPKTGLSTAIRNESNVRQVFEDLMPISWGLQTNQAFRFSHSHFAQPFSQAEFMENERDSTDIIMGCIQEVVSDLSDNDVRELRSRIEPLFGSSVVNGQLLTADMWNRLVARVASLEEKVGVKPGVLGEQKRIGGKLS